MIYSLFSTTLLYTVQLLFIILHPSAETDCNDHIGIITGFFFSFSLEINFKTIFHRVFFTNLQHCLLCWQTQKHTHTFYSYFSEICCVDRLALKIYRFCKKSKPVNNGITLPNLAIYLSLTHFFSLSLSLSQHCFSSPFLSTL